MAGGNRQSILTTTRLGKACWTAGAVIVTVGRLPFWAVKFLPKALRQHPEWTYGQAIMNEIMGTAMYHWSVLEIPTPLSLDPAAEKERFVKIPFQKDNYYTGVLAHPTIKPTVVGGIWFPAPYSLTSDSQLNVILYFHGGAFVMGDGRTAVSGFAASTLSKAFGDAKVLAFSYRLASNPGGQFPAAVQDAVSAYQYLLDQGIDPKLVILAGDSAGCAIALALLRYLDTKHEGKREPLIPTPLAAIFSSPWVDIHSARKPAFPDVWKHLGTDYVPSELQAWGARTYVTGKEDSVAEAYISPHGHPFNTSALLFFCIGGVENLGGEGLEFAESMRKAGNKVEVHLEPYTNHAILAIGNVTGFAKEAERAIGIASKTIIGENRQRGGSH